MKTLKKVTLVALLFLSSSIAFAQAFDDGTNLVYLGFGLVPGPKIKDSNRIISEKIAYYDYKYKNYGTVVFKYERGLHKYFGLGLNAEYSNNSFNYKYLSPTATEYEVTTKNNIIGAYGRMNGHLPLVDKLDIYGGVGLGYLISFNRTKDTNPSSVLDQKENVLVFDYNLSIGARFMVKDNVGVFFEVGSYTTRCQLGMAMKF